MQKAMLFKIYFFGLCAFDTESQEEKRREESNLGCSVTTCVHALWTQDALENTFYTLINIYSLERIDNNNLL